MNGELHPHLAELGALQRKLATAEWRRCAVLGHSIAEGLGEPSPGYADLPWFERVRSVLAAAQPELAFVNLARRDVRAGRVRAEQLPAALDFAPDLAVLVAGGDDPFPLVFGADPVQDEHERSR